MKALKIVLGIIGALIVCAVLLALFAQHEEKQQEAKWVQKENDEKVQADNLLPSIELFDLTLGDIRSTGNDQVWVREISGRVRNKSAKGLSRLTIKISILDSQDVPVDTYSAYISGLGLGAGDVKSFSSAIDIQRVPKGFKWQYKATDGTFF